MLETIERQKNFMNTTITIKVDKQSGTVKTLLAIEKAFGEFERIVRLYSRFDSKSLLSKLNLKQEEWVQLSDEFFFLVEYIMDLAKKTNGVFDPTIIDYLELYGYDSKYNFDKLNDPKLEEKIKELTKIRPSWKEILLDRKNKKIKLAKNQRIELGGIGKGYAIDCAYNILEKVSGRFLIDAGGDIRGKSNTKPWEVGLKEFNGTKVEVKSSIKLSNEAIASSGSWARKIKRFHHLINPITGVPVEQNYKTVFVIAENALTADSWATPLFIGGADLVKALPKGVLYYYS